MLYSVCFLHNPGPPVQRCHWTQWPGSSHVNHQPRHPYMQDSSAEGPSFQVTGRCVRLTKTIHTPTFVHSTDVLLIFMTFIDLLVLQTEANFLDLFSSSTTWVPDIELRSSVLAARAFIFLLQEWCLVTGKWYKATIDRKKILTLLRVILPVYADCCPIQGIYRLRKKGDGLDLIADYSWLGKQVHKTITSWGLGVKQSSFYVCEWNHAESPSSCLSESPTWTLLWSVCMHMGGGWVWMWVYAFHDTHQSSRAISDVCFHLLTCLELELPVVPCCIRQLASLRASGRLSLLHPPLQRSSGIRGSESGFTWPTRTWTQVLKVSWGDLYPLSSLPNSSIFISGSPKPQSFFPLVKKIIISS